MVVFIIRNNQTMRHLSAKISITLACAIILLHAVVPHHHHDCADEAGFVFETEINCHCSHQHLQHGCNDECNDHHSDHPFDICRLADMLSHLVLNTKEDEQLMAQVVKAEVHDLLLALLPNSGEAVKLFDSECSLSTNFDVPWALPLPTLAGSHSLRAPPLCV